ncbi:MAG TPA: DUF4188 domain-containing protein [Acidimicrobiia bacterium]|nr:DUF4188 domain-containing protein [Acidimicrobiia bacterium]
MQIHNGRYTADIDGDFVVFLIGARVNKPLRFRTWFPVAKAMTTMQREIAQHPEIGCLHIENFGALRGVSVQYWRSFDHLERFARSAEWSHLESWRKFNELIRDGGDVGIWHETYRVRQGEYEGLYGNMPVFGLATAGRHVKIEPRSTAASRAGVRPADTAPIEGY